MSKIRKYLLIILIILWAVVLVPRMCKTRCSIFPKPKLVIAKYIQTAQPIKIDIADSLPQAFKLLRAREDSEALDIFNKVLLEEPKNQDALWGKAEVLRRSRKYAESEKILKQVLTEDPNYPPALLSLAYIRYKDDALDEAKELVSKALMNTCDDYEDSGLACMMLGAINSRRASKSWIFGKIIYGTKIKNYFLKAVKLAPNLPEAHLGLGTFYINAPRFMGGDLNKGVEELLIALKLAPKFATVNARLAQAYQKSGDQKNYEFYLKRARELDPDNEVIKELKENK
ncbi:MAG: tetratricopeptide repeat protein [Candidatus Omnitrophota bacterium]